MLRPMPLIIALSLVHLTCHSDELDMFLEQSDESDSINIEWSGVILSSVTHFDESNDNNLLTRLAFRPEFKAQFSDRKSLVIHIDADAMSTRNSLSWQDVVGGNIMDQSLSLSYENQDNRSRQSATVDWMYYESQHDNLSYSIGRQPITLGFGKIWSPTDTLAPFSFFDLDRLYKHGVDALRLNYFVNDKMKFDSIVSFNNQDHLSRSESYLQSIQWYGEDINVLSTIANRAERKYLSLSTLFTNLSVGGDLYFEMQYGKLATAEQLIWSKNNYDNFLIGYSNKVTNNSVMTIELFTQSLGTKNPEHYEEQLNKAYQSLLPNMGLAHRYIALSFSSQFSPLASYEVLMINNLVDNGINLSGLLKYNYFENLEIRASIAYSPNFNSKNSEYAMYSNIVQLGINYYY